MRTLYRLFASLKSAIILMAALTVLSLIGTLIPQNKESAEYLANYPVTGHWILALGFDNMYHSMIFVSGMVLLSISTLVCILTRWKATSRKIFARLERVSDKEIAAMKHSRFIERADNLDVVRLSSNKTIENGAVIGCSVSGWLSLLGGMFIHIGFLLILLGGLAGLHYGVETVIRGSEGDRVPIAPVEAIRAARNSDRLARRARALRSVSPSHPELEGLRQQIEVLHEQYHKGLAEPAFRIAFDELWIDHHKDEDGNILGVKSWNSRVRFVEDDTETEPVLLRVNHPASYGSYTFYQASWHHEFRRVQIKVELRDDSPEGWEHFDTAEEFPKIIELDYDKPLKLEWAPFTLLLHNFFPDFRIINDRFTSVSNQLNNPAAQIVAFDDDSNPVGRAIAFLPDRVMSPDHVSKLPFLFTFYDAEPVHESGLQMAYDPGKPIVWLGCIIFTIGLIMSFYITYKEEWMVLMPDGSAILAVAGNRPVDTMHDWLDSLQQKVTISINQDQKT